MVRRGRRGRWGRWGQRAARLAGGHGWGVKLAADHGWGVKKRWQERDGTGAGVSPAPGSADASDSGLCLVSSPFFRGVVYRDEQPRVWVSLLRLEPRVRDQVALFGLELVLDEAEGFAYVRQREPEEGEEALPRLVPRRPLGYMVSLLLALLRKKLAEHDATGGRNPAHPHGRGTGGHGAAVPAPDGG